MREMNNVTAVEIGGNVEKKLLRENRKSYKKESRRLAREEAQHLELGEVLAAGEVVAWGADNGVDQEEEEDWDVVAAREAADKANKAKDNNNNHVGSMVGEQWVGTHKTWEAWN